MPYPHHPILRFTRSLHKDAGNVVGTSSLTTIAIAGAACQVPGKPLRSIIFGPQISKHIWIDSGYIRIELRERDQIWVLTRDTILPGKA